jgi:hypothetical protein
MISSDLNGFKKVRLNASCHVIQKPALVEVVKGRITSLVERVVLPRTLG